MISLARSTQTEGCTSMADRSWRILVLSNFMGLNSFLFSPERQNPFLSPAQHSIGETQGKYPKIRISIKQKCYGCAILSQRKPKGDGEKMTSLQIVYF